MTCKEIHGRLNDYIDRELAQEEMDTVRMHLTLCVTCAKEFLLDRAELHHIRHLLNRIQIPVDLKEKISAVLSREQQ